METSSGFIGLGDAWFSVIVPVLNRRNCIERCLRSIETQSHRAEIIVIDGGSTDGTLGLLEQHSDRITYQESGCDTGISDAFNRGISKASADWIAILNSDDWWEPDALIQVYEAIDRDPRPRIIHGSCLFHGPKGTYLKHPDLDAMGKYMSLYHSTCFVHRDIYKEIGCYRTDFSNAMDSEFLLRAISRSILFESIPCTIANISMGGISDTNFLRSLLEYRKSVIEHGIASGSYATLYFLLHLAVKVGYRIPGFNYVKKFVDKKINPTIDYGS